MGELQVGDFIAAPRHLFNAKRVPAFVEMLPSDTTYIYDEDLIVAAKENYETVDNVVELAQKHGIPANRLYTFKCKGQSTTVDVAHSLGVPVEQAAILKTQRQSGRGVPLNLSYAPSQSVLLDVCYLAGLVNSDGTLSNPTQVQFVNTDKGLHTRFVKTVSNMGLTRIYQERRGKTHYSTVASKTLNMLLKGVWNHLTELHPGLVAAFLQGYADGDGGFSDYHIRLCTTRDWKADRLKIACLLLDIRTYRETKNRDTYNQNLIIHPACHARFKELIGFRQQSRRKKLAAWEGTRWSSERLDVVPATLPLRRVYEQAKERGINTRSFAPLSNSLISDAMNGKALSRVRYEFVVNRLSDSGVDTAELDSLSCADVVWQQITTIEDLDDHGERYVYDLTVEGLHSFVANGLITHNCFVDEVESVFPRRDTQVNGDSGVSGRIMTTVMQFMSDKDRRGKVVWFFATNYPEKMDDAFVRSGRVDAKVPVLLPDQQEREALLSLGLDSVATGLIDEDYSELAARLDGYTGAEIMDGVAVKAIALASDEASRWQDAVVTRQHLEEAVRKVRRTTRGIPAMTATALANTDDLDLLPESYWNQLQPIDEAEEEAGIEASNGRQAVRNRQL